MENTDVLYAMKIWFVFWLKYYFFSRLFFGIGIGYRVSAVFLRYRYRIKNFFGYWYRYRYRITKKLADTYPLNLSVASKCRKWWFLCSKYVCLMPQLATCELQVHQDTIIFKKNVATVRQTASLLTFVWHKVNSVYNLGVP